MNSPSSDPTDNAPLPTYRAAREWLTPLQWFSLLEEYLPRPYIHARAADLALLRADGCSPHAASVYAKVHLLAPRELGTEPAPWAS